MSSWRSPRSPVRAGDRPYRVCGLIQGSAGPLLMANSRRSSPTLPGVSAGDGARVQHHRGTFASFLGLVVGGALAGIDWRLVFLVSVPFGLFGTVWAYATSRETGTRAPARLDIWGNVTFAVGLVLLMIGLTYGLQPYGTHTMGWSSPVVLSELIGGVLLLALFLWIENRVPEPMFHLSLFRVRGFAGRGNGEPACEHGTWGPAVHVDPLDPGDMAASPRLLVRADTSVVGHLHGPDVGRVSRGRDLWRGGFRTATASGGSPPRAWSSQQLHSSPSCCCQFISSTRLVRDPLVLQRDRGGVVRGPEHDHDHERGTSGSAGGGVGDAGDVHEFRIRAVDRDLLLSDGPRPSCTTPGEPVTGPRRTGCLSDSRTPRRGRYPRSGPCSLRSSATTRWGPCSDRTCLRASGRLTRRRSPARPSSDPHLRTVPFRARHRLLCICGALCCGRGCELVGRQLRGGDCRVTVAGGRGDGDL